MVHYRTHKRPPPVSILGQPNPVHIPTSHLLEIHPNIIHPSKPRSPQWSLSLRFPHQDPIPPLSSPLHTTSPAHLILLDFITCIILGSFCIQQIKKKAKAECKRNTVKRRCTPLEYICALLFVADPETI